MADTVILALNDSLAKDTLSSECRGILTRQRAKYLANHQDLGVLGAARVAAAKKRTNTAQGIHSVAVPIIRELQGAGLTYKEIAVELEKLGIRSIRGVPYTYNTIRLMLKNAREAG